jgi:23S rRNA (pseudouridine1915-N3)-methyltransferase
MRTVLLTVGKAKAPFAEADAHYLRLLDRYQPVDLVEAQDDESLVSRLPGQGRVAAIDARGRAMGSEEWAGWLQERRLEARDLYLLVGGPRGLPQAALERADEVISLGPQTLAHQLARVVVLEQLFRAAKIAAGEPYHY